MSSLDRRAKVESAKALGRAAYQLGQAGEIAGNVMTEGEDKQLREYHRGRIFIELWQPWRSDADADEFSRLRLRYDGSLVLELRWTAAGSFRVLKFERGEWERSVQARACF
jgi:hypothetical protein